MHMERRTVSVPSAAAALGVSRATAFRKISDGTFPLPTIRIGKRIVVPVEPLERLLAGKAQVDTSVPASHEPQAA